MGTKVHYPLETKMKAIEMKQQGYTNGQIMEQLGIKNKSQVKQWMRWYKTGQDHRLSQPIGKQYSYGKGPAELSELEQKDLQIRQLKAKVAVLEKLEEVLRRWNQR